MLASWSNVCVCTGRISIWLGLFLSQALLLCHPSGPAMSVQLSSLCRGKALEGCFIWGGLRVAAVSTRASGAGSGIGAAANRLMMPVPPQPHALRRGEGIGGGPAGRIAQLRRCVAGLFQHERLELPWLVAVETRQYAERLLQEAIRTELSVGDLSSRGLTEMMSAGPTECPEICALLELSAFWLGTPEMIEKLLKVLVPRYRLYNRSFTCLFRLQRPTYPSRHVGLKQGFGVLELRDNPWPPIGRPHLPRAIGNRASPSTEPFKENYFINVLVSAARTARRRDHDKSPKPQLPEC